MAKTSATYVCQSCGAVSAKWSGKCDACGGWNTITEEGAAPPLGSGAARRVKGRKIADRVAMIYKGRIIWSGRKDEIDRSGNPYVDQFINGRAEGPIKMEVRAL